jgi:hypothetical protein
VAQLFSLGIITHTMKRFTIIGLFIILIILCVLLFWRHAKLTRDQDMQSRLTGTWTLELLDILRDTNTVASDGSFHLQEATGTNLFQVTGTWRIKNGDLVDTTTSNTARIGVRLPHTDIHHIVRLDDSELVALWYSTNEATWKKVAK